MPFSYDVRVERLRMVAGAARRQPVWCGVALSLAVGYTVFLLGMKALSSNVVDSFFAQLPSRAAANPALVDLPLCIVFTPASPAEDLRLFGFGGYESWSFPGRWMVGPLAGLSVEAPNDGSDLALRLAGTALTGGKRPQVAYDLSVNGNVLARGVLTEANPKLDVLVRVPAVPQPGLRTVLVELRTPDVLSAQAAGISQDWRKLGISLSAITLFRVAGPSCP